MYAEKWQEEDFYEYVTRDRETEEPSEKQKSPSAITEDSGPGAMELTEPCPYENRGEEPGDGKQNRKEKKKKQEKKHRKSKEERQFNRERKQNRKNGPLSRFRTN